MRFNDRYEDQDQSRFIDFVKGVTETILVNFNPPVGEQLAIVSHDFATHDLRYELLEADRLRDYLIDYLHKVKSGPSMEVTGSAWRSVSFVVRIGDRDVEKIHIIRPTRIL